MSRGGRSVHCDLIQALEKNGTTSVFIVCLDRPGSDQNIIGEQFVFELAGAVRLARKLYLSGEADLLVLCSAKRGAFLAGADIQHELKKYVGPLGKLRAFSDSKKLQGILCALESLPIPTVAVLNGTTLGGGLELALACDYRIASMECRQIGLPEVKLGVLPGAGGCYRLPRLIGFRSAMELLITGNPVSSKKALTLGIVDALSSKTQTSVVQATGDQTTFSYDWLSEVLDCVEKGMIGKKPFSVRCRRGVSAIDVSVGWKETKLLEDELEEEVSHGESVAVAKHPPRAFGWCGELVANCTNYLLYVAGVLMLMKRIGRTMPAPFVCLQTAFQCHQTPDWTLAQDLNSLGFARLAITAESKSLMSLFVSMRALRKFSVSFADSGDNNVQSVKEFDLGTTSVCVFFDTEGLRYSSAFVQGLAYAGVGVAVVGVASAGGAESHGKFMELVRKHFGYAVSKGHLTDSDAASKVDAISVLENMEEVQGFLAEQDKVVLVDAMMGRDKEGGVLSDEFEKIVAELKGKCDLTTVSAVPQQGSASSSSCCCSVSLDYGDPLRKNSICVEVMPASLEVKPKQLRTVSSLVATIGKFPVLVPYWSLGSLNGFLTVQHWSLAARVLAGGRVSASWLDRCLVDVGFAKGPFKAMKELDSAYVSRLVAMGASAGVWCKALKAFLTGGKAAITAAALGKGGRGRERTSQRRKIPLSADQVSKLFICNLSCAALLVKKLLPSVPEAAVDVLSVGSLVHFPPSEGGPLAYLVRNGEEGVLSQLQSVSGFGGVFEEEADRLIQLLRHKDSHLTAEMLFKPIPTPASSSKVIKDEFLESRMELSPLSASELAKVGPTLGLRHPRSLLYPLPFSSLPPVVLLFLFLALLLGGGAFLLTWGGFACVSLLHTAAVERDLVSSYSFLLVLTVCVAVSFFCLCKK